jgi:hypothetical protein
VLADIWMPLDGAAEASDKRVHPRGVTRHLNPGWADALPGALTITKPFDGLTLLAPLGRAISGRGRGTRRGVWLMAEPPGRGRVRDRRLA